MRVDCREVGCKQGRVSELVYVTCWLLGCLGGKFLEGECWMRKKVRGLF